MREHPSVPKRLKIVPDDIREGLLAFISVFVEEPQFQGQTKDRLNNPELKKQVHEALSAPFQANPSWKARRLQLYGPR